VKHREANDLSNCHGELKLKTRIVFDSEPYEEYHCTRCGKWVYLPVNGGFKFETRIRI
jgi:hypothetical protein